MNLVGTTAYLQAAYRDSRAGWARAGHWGRELHLQGLLQHLLRLTGHLLDFRKHSVFSTVTSDRAACVVALQYSDIGNTISALSTKAYLWRTCHKLQGMKG